MKKEMVFRDFLSTYLRAKVGNNAKRLNWLKTLDADWFQCSEDLYADESRLRNEARYILSRAELFRPAFPSFTKDDEIIIYTKASKADLFAILTGEMSFDEFNRMLSELTEEE